LPAVQSWWPGRLGAGAPRGRWFLRFVEERDGLTLHVNLWPGDAPGPPNDIPRATQRNAARHGPSAEARGRTQDPHDQRARGACLHALEFLTSDRPGSVAYRACTSTSGRMCTESPRPCARAGAPHVAARVAVVPRPHERRCRSRVCGRGGSDPGLRVPSTAQRWSGCARPSQPRLGSLPVHPSRAGRPRRAVTGLVSVSLGDAEQPDGQAVGQRVPRRLEAALDTLPGTVLVR